MRVRMAWMVIVVLQTGLEKIVKSGRNTHDSKQRLERILPVDKV